MRYTPIEGEEWKTADGFNNALRISNKGRAASVKHFKFKGERFTILKLRKGRNGGYLSGGIKINNTDVRFCVHRLVAKLFIPIVKGKDIVNHINGVTTDNRVENLEWCDKRGNMIHAMNVLNVKRGGSENPNSRYTEEQVAELRRLRNSGLSIYSCIKITGFKQTTAYYILKNKLRNIKNIK